MVITVEHADARGALGVQRAGGDHEPVEGAKPDRSRPFPQVAQAVCSGSFSGVLPSFARSELAAAEFRMSTLPALEAVATPLLLAWRARTLELRPQVKHLQRALAEVVRRTLKTFG